MHVWDLWLPILAATIGVHALCTLCWTALPHHKSEWTSEPMGAQLAETIRQRGFAPDAQIVLTEGEETSKDPASGRGMLILWKHKPSMGANVGMTLGFMFFAAVTIGYLASIAFDRGAPRLDVFRFTATAGLLTHAAAGVPNVIWFRRKFLMDFLDGVAYALVTGAAFAALWPE